MLLKLFQVFLVLLPLRLICRADSIFPAVGALLRLSRAAKDKMALITDENHFNHRGVSISVFSLIINHNFPQEGAAKLLLFYARRRDFFEETKLLGPLRPSDSQVLCPNDDRRAAVYLYGDTRLCPG